MDTKMKAMLASYARSVLAGAAALYMAGVTDPADLAYALVAAIAPVALRALNPNDPSFGRVPSVEEVEVAVKSAKAPVKKAAVKRTAKSK